MEGTWTMVYVSWGLIIAVLVGIEVWEHCKTPERKAREKKAAQERYEKAQLAKKIVEVKLLDETTARAKRFGCLGAFFGLAYGGILGALVGPFLPGCKTKKLCMFLVRYGDGHKKIFYCAPGSWEYKAWMKRVNQ